MSLESDCCDPVARSVAFIAAGIIAIALFNSTRSPEQPISRRQADLETANYFEAQRLSANGKAWEPIGQTNSWCIGGAWQFGEQEGRPVRIVHVVREEP